jgi:carnitine-CoA ligase
VSRYAPLGSGPQRSLPKAVHPFSGTDIWELLSVRADRTPSKPFLIWHPYEGIGRVWTYAEFHRDASAIAASLRERCVTAGDLVAIHLENKPELVLTLFACAALQAPAVLVNTRFSADELQYCMENARAAVIVTQSSLLDVAASALSASDSLRSCVVVGETSEVGSHLGRELPWDVVAFSALASRPDAADELDGRTPDPSQPFAVLYTSGTENRPKGVVWSHANALWAASVNAAHEALLPSDVHLIHMPLFHANALGYSLLPSLWVGATCVLVPKWSTSRFWGVSQAYGCTWLSLSSLAYRALAQGEVPADHQYRLFGSGWCDPPLARQYGVKTIGWWGMTETISQPIVGSAYVPDRPRSMGRPSAEYEVAVVDAEGQPVGDECPGELVVRGVRGLSLFQEYLNDADATEAAFRDGWFRTGDIVVSHADGYLSFVERAKDMLKVGGENVAAAEIERVILDSRLVSEAAVVSVPDTKLDEVPVAFVIPAPGAAADLSGPLLDLCRAKLADFKVPRQVHVVTEFPRSTLVKINKRRLREAALDPASLEKTAEMWRREARMDPSGEYRS